MTDPPKIGGPRTGRERIDRPHYSHALAVRWRDLDALGHVNYATYLTYLEEARDAWLARDLALNRGTEYAVGRVSIEYRSEITLLDEPLSIEVRVTSIGNSSLTTSERILAADGRLAAEAEVTIVFWDRHRRRSRPISAEERSILVAAATEGAR